MNSHPPPHFRSPGPPVRPSSGLWSSQESPFPPPPSSVLAGACDRSGHYHPVLCEGNLLPLHLPPPPPGNVWLGRTAPGEPRGMGVQGLGEQGRALPKPQLVAASLSLGFQQTPHSAGAADGRGRPGNPRGGGKLWARRASRASGVSGPLESTVGMPRGRGSHHGAK